MNTRAHQNKYIMKRSRIGTIKMFQMSWWNFISNKCDTEIYERIAMGAFNKRRALLIKNFHCYLQKRIVRTLVCGMTL